MVLGLPLPFPQSSESSRRHHGPAARRADAEPRARQQQASAYRVRRIDGSPSGVAVGVAWGVAVSFTPFYFLHIGIAVAGSWLMGGSLLAAAIGTLFLNPLTFPIISWLTYSVGNYFLPRSTDIQVEQVPSMSYIFDNFSDFFSFWDLKPFV